MILLCEDGSLRIHLTGSADSILYWLQQQFQPSSPLACLNAHSMTKVSSFQKRGGAPKFPVDFFEHCQRMSNNEVDVSNKLRLLLYSVHTSLSPLLEAIYHHIEQLVEWRVGKRGFQNPCFSSSLSLPALAVSVASTALPLHIGSA